MAEKTITLKVEVEAGSAVKAVDKLNTSIDNTKKSIDSSTKATKAMTNGISAMGLALRAAGIGLVIKAFSAFFDVLNNNQRVMDIMATATETVSIFLNDLVQALIDTYDKVSELTGGFDATGRIIMNLIKIGITPLKLAFYEIKAVVLAAQLIWENSFFGDKDPVEILRLTDAIKEVGIEITEVVKGAITAGVEIAGDFKESIGEFVTLGKVAMEELSDVSLTAAYEQAKVNVALQKSALIAIAQNRLLIEQYDIQAEKQRQIIDDERASIGDRIKANDELKRILTEQATVMAKNADLIVASAAAQYSKNKSDENYVALLEAQAEKQGILAQVGSQMSAVLSQHNSLYRERQEMIKSLNESEAKLTADQKLFNAELIDDETAKLEALIKIRELEREMELERLQSIIDNEAAGTQAKLDAIIAYNEGKQELDQAVILSEQALADKLVEIDQKRNEKMALADKQRIQNGVDLGMAGLSAMNDIFSLLEQAAGDNFEKQKDYQIAGAVIQGLMGLLGAWAGAMMTPSPTPVQLILAALSSALIIGVTVANIAKIKSTKPGGASSAPSSSGAKSISAPPSLNLVSPLSTGEEQLSSAVGDQTNDPSKSYVVGSDVTSQQEMDRHIQANA